jgi:hypothetical protein
MRACNLYANIYKIVFIKYLRRTQFCIIERDSAVTKKRPRGGVSCGRTPGCLIFSVGYGAVSSINMFRSPWVRHFTLLSLSSLCSNVHCQYCRAIKHQCNIFPHWYNHAFISFISMNHGDLNGVINRSSGVVFHLLFLCFWCVLLCSRL